MSSQKSVSLRKRCTAPIITLTQMHITIVWVLGTWRVDEDAVLFDMSDKNLARKKCFSSPLLVLSVEWL